MTSPLDDQVRKLLSKDAIRDIYIRYARGVDRLDLDLLRSCFFEDATLHIGELTETVDSFVNRMASEKDSREACQHYVINTSIELDGDVAHVEAYWLAVSKVKEGNTYSYSSQGPADDVVLMGGRYVDRVECRGGEWRKAVGWGSFEWRGSASAAGMAEFVAVGGFKARDESDLSYWRPLTGQPPVAVS
jgi:hypothetical protein